MARAKSLVTLVAADTEVAASGTSRTATSTQNFDGGLLTLRIRNGGTLGAQCVCTVAVSHVDGTVPATAATGDTSTWKQVYQFGSGTVSAAVTATSFEFGPGVRHIQVEFTGHTSQPVHVEALMTLYDYEA